LWWKASCIGCKVGIGRFGEAFDGRDRLAVNTDRQQRAALIETPSIWTTQAPHCEVSQPNMGTGEIEVLAEEIG